MKRIPFLAAIAAVLILLSSCHSGSSGLLIPKDAVLVVQINNSALSSKLTWAEIKQTGWYKDAYAEMKDSLGRKVMENPDASGVDIKSDMAFFLKPQGKGGYSVFQGKIKDAAAFEGFLKNMKSSITVEKEGDYKYVKERNTLLTWNSSRFILMNDMPVLGMANNMYGMRNGEDISFPADSLRKFTTALIDLKGDNSLTDDKRFRSLLKEDGDMHFWLNAEKYYSGMTGGAFSMMKVSDLFKGNISTAALSFDNGKITVKGKQYYGETMASIMNKYKFKNIDAALLGRIPSKDVMAIFVGSTEPGLIEEILTTAGVNGVINGFLGKYNSSLHEAISAMKGDMLLAVTDVSVKREPSQYGSSSPKPDGSILFALSINNKAVFDKMLNIARQQAGGDTAELNKIAYKTTNDWFAIGNKRDAVDGFLSGTAKNSQSFAGKITGHHFGGFIDLQKAIRAGSGFGSEADEAFGISLKMWQDVTITGDYNNGAASSEFVINLVDKSTNSLKQISRYADEVAAAQKRARAKREMEDEQQYKTDSSGVIAPPVEDLVPTPPPPAPLPRSN
jgi:hypothetical protein